MANTVQNTAAIAEFESGAMKAARPVGAEIAASREAHEVQVAMVAAKRFPRDNITAYNRIMSDCQRKSLAEKALYEYPRGGQVVTGPSIHLARALARGWGNLDSGFKVLEATAKESTVMAYCWDLETNYRETKVFTVPHIRQTKNGSYPLADPRDIYETVANQAARRERACILSVIPSDVVDAAVGQCNATLVNGEKMNLTDGIRDIVKRFQEQYGITKEMLEKYIGCNADAFSVQSVIRLRNVYTALRDGSASVEQYFGASANAPEKSARKKEGKPEPEQTPQADGKQVGLDDL